ncbi:MAG: DUF421 domain-containing protein [Clostridia bacterium]|nr:DUF421 domain-containing protein [Clostridia bacterium]
MIIIAARTLLMYVFVVLTLRLMGKRQIGELEASELVVTIIISEIAALPITDTGVPLVGSILAILVLLLLEICLSQLAYRNVWVRTALYGKPSMFYSNGKLHQEEMRKQRFNVGDLMEELRNQGVVNLNQVEYVLMETNGKVSVILSAEESPVTPQDMDISTQPVRMSYVLIDNGNLIRNNLKRLGLDERWVEKQLKEHKLSHISQVFYLSFEQGTGKIVLIPKEE